MCVCVLSAIVQSCMDLNRLMIWQYCTFQEQLLKSPSVPCRHYWVNTARFTHWQTKQAAAVRYIRMACEVFGPRGDEQIGCRDSWMAYCSMMQIKSTVPSFKANRFNSLFVGAASLHFHQLEILNFFGHTCLLATRTFKACCKMPSVKMLTFLLQPLQ